jgi:hypothetical protein
MKTFLTVVTLVVLILAMSALSFAQTDTSPTNLYAAGISYNAGASPAIAGTGLWAHKVADTGTYAFTAVDALPTSTKPLVVNTNFSAGVAQKVLTIGKVPIFIPTSAGISYNGSNTGWAWTTGALASIRVKDKFRICPNVRLVKSSVSNGEGYQPVVGILFGWGE